MAEESAKLRIPYIAAAQAQKHVTHNEGMTLLDTLVQLSVIDKDLAAPPAEPEEGDTYIVAVGGTGAWEGWDKRVVRFIDGTWRSYLPGQGGGAGWLAYVIDEESLYVFTGSEWERLFIAGGGGGAVDSVNGQAGAVLLDAADIPFEPAGLAHTDATDMQEALEDHDAALETKVSKAGDAMTGSLSIESGSTALTVQAQNAPGALITSLHNTPTGGGIVLRRARHTSGTPEAVQSGDFIVSVSGRGYHSGGAFPTVGTGAFAFRATENFTSSAQGTDCVFRTTPNGSATPGDAMVLGQDKAAYFPGIGTTASAANAFLDSGSTPANKLLRSTSSLAYKRDIETLEPDYADKVLQLRPVWYRSKAPADRPGWSWYGLIAEEVAEIEPRLATFGYAEDAWDEIVVEGADGDRHVERRLKPDAVQVPDGVQYDRVGVLLLNVVRRLRERMGELESRIADLEAAQD